MELFAVSVCHSTSAFFDDNRITEGSTNILNPGVFAKKTENRNRKG